MKRLILSIWTTKGGNLLHIRSLFKKKKKDGLALHETFRHIIKIQIYLLCKIIRRYYWNSMCNILLEAFLFKQFGVQCLNITTIMVLRTLSVVTQVEHNVG